MADDRDPKPWWAPDLQSFVAVAVVFMTAGAVFYRMAHPSQVEDKLLDMMLTLLVGTAFVGVVGWAVGSSRGSQVKDEAQTKMVEKLTTTALATSGPAAVTAAAEAAAPAAAEKVAAEAARVAAPPAAEVAAPPAAEAAAPAAAREAVAEALAHPPKAPTP